MTRLDTKTIFAGSVMAMLILVMGYLFNVVAGLENKVEAFSSSSIEMKVQLSQIQADLVWIKLRLSNDSERLIRSSSATGQEQSVTKL